jgi:hypothetical protein
MEDNERAAVLVSLLQELRGYKGWGGETHIQKATFFLERLLGVPLGFDFIIYRYGPFSFDLSDELASMVSSRAIKLVPEPPYGPHLEPDEKADQLQAQFEDRLTAYKNAVSFVAAELGDLGVAELEPLSTALFVTPVAEDGPVADPNTVDERAAEIVRLKPHISSAKAKSSVRKIDKLIAKSKELRLPLSPLSA